jgi:hypothetical protein
MGGCSSNGFFPPAVLYFKKLIDDLETHLAGSASKNTTSHFLIGRVHVLHLVAGHFEKFRTSELPDFFLVRLGWTQRPRSPPFSEARRQEISS